MVESIRLTCQAVAAGLGWALITTCVVTGLIHYLKVHPDVEPATIVDASLYGWAAVLGLLYEAVELHSRRWFIRLHLGGLLYALGAGITFSHSMPIMMQIIFAPDRPPYVRGYLWWLVGALIFVVAALFWTFQPSYNDEESRGPAQRAPQVPAKSQPAE